MLNLFTLGLVLLFAGGLLASTGGQRDDLKEALAVALGIIGLIFMAIETLLQFQGPQP